MFEAERDGTLQPLRVGRRRRQRFERGTHLLRAHARAAGEVKPEHRLTLAERVRQRFTEAKLALRDRLPAAAALGARARGRLDHVGQVEFLRSGCTRRELGGAPPGGQGASPARGAANWRYTARSSTSGAPA